MTRPTDAERLYRILPAVYRERDSDAHLARWLDACGLLLDQLRRTLDQRLADHFPDTPLDGGPTCQDWLLPYFADLLDVRLVSPTAAGRRAEIANAIRWRQRRGTLAAVEEIAEGVGRLEMVVQEGWQRVARTPRIGMTQPPLPAATVYGYPAAVADTPPALAASHPGLPAVTPDLRRPSGAVASDLGNPAAQQSTVDGDTRVWRQASLHGVPCRPGGFDDVSARTPDLRGPDWRVGHAHPQRVLLFSVPPAGFFPPGLPSVNWADPPSAAFRRLIEVVETPGRTTYRNRSLDTDSFVPVRIRRPIQLGQVPSGVGPVAAHTWRFEGLILDSTLELDSGRVELARCAVRRLEAQAVDLEAPVIDARGCLFGYLQTAQSLARLEYCTVLGRTLVERLQASDCLFVERIRKHHMPTDPPDAGCIRFSAVWAQQSQGGMDWHAVTRRPPVFFETRFGRRGCGVLHPATPAAIRRGAEDGGEPGAFHDDHLSRRAEATLDKLADALPLGQRAVLIPDHHLPELPG